MQAMTRTFPAWLVPLVVASAGASIGVASGLAEGPRFTVASLVSLARAPDPSSTNGVPGPLLSAARVAPLVSSGPVVAGLLGRVTDEVEVLASAVTPELLRIVVRGPDADEATDLAESLSERVLRVQAGELSRYRATVASAIPGPSVVTELFLAPPLVREASLLGPPVVVSSSRAVAQRGVAGMLVALAAFVLVRRGVRTKGISAVS